MPNYQKEIADAIKHFWKVRTSQFKRQTSSPDKADAGQRGAVTGGKHLDGFIDLLAKILADAGLPDTAIHKRTTTLPGYFRPTKNWDIVVVADDQLVASHPLRRTLCKGATRRNIFLVTLYLFLDNPAPLF